MRTLASTLTAAALVLLCGSASTRSSQESVPVWILPFDELGDEESSHEVGRAIADLLTAALSRSPHYAVVDREALAAVLDERSLSAAGLARPQPEGGLKLVWARWMLHGTVTRQGTRLSITAHVTEVGSTRILGSAQASGESAALPAMVQELAAQLTRIPRVAGRGAAAGDADGAPVANLHFMRGLSHYHARQYHRALAEFLRSGADPEVGALSSLWRANCYLATQRHDHAFLELTRLRRWAPRQVDPDDVQRLLDECLEHLSPEEVQAYGEL